ncbi:hypothetical protein FIA58_013780 [Flavobacterium jejuense]|uniref:Cell division protein FtsQ n=1 Tax=Flavobacterium jejuense TaxID=1544455 RepID=A0ABX0ISA4_9FLAO|nr:hypothetical protein [Flavobacterium jejuense]NHN26750.1 hypothetical protein [Flavobacterium jejuense]
MTFTEIQQSILNAKASATELNALEVLTTNEQTVNSANSTSKVAIWRLWVWIFSFAIWVMYQIVNKNALNSRPQNLPNFRQTILNFRDGLNLVWKDGAFNYDLTGVVDAEERLIIDRCAVLESNDGELVVKVATDNAGVLEPITEPQKTRLLDYIRQIKVPGVRIRLINEVADKLKIDLTVYVDPLIIDLNDGKLLNTTDTVYPVQDAINDYLSNLEFNGAFVNDFFRSKIKEAEGINLAVIDSIQWKYASFPFISFNEFKVPESGYFKIEETDLNINYLPYVLVNN